MTTPDVPWMESLMRREYEAVGFIPRTRLQWYADRDQVLVATENDDPCGYLVFGNGWPMVKVYQAVVDYSARRREHGLALVARLVERARRKGAQGISLWCADDLDANDFWRAAGFSFAGARRLANRRGRSHNRWVLWLDGQPTLGLSE